MISTETTALIRRHDHRNRTLGPHDADEDLADPEADRREADMRVWNAALELAASLMRLRGHKADAALILRQRKGSEVGLLTSRPMRGASSWA